MWLQTSIGFFSIVQKPEDIDEGMVTIRARVEQDLLRLKEFVLPSMSEICGSSLSDYPFRARASKTEVNKAIGSLVEMIDYSNFKSNIHKRQGAERAKIYGKVWSDLTELSKLQEGYIDLKTDESIGIRRS